MKKAFLVSLMAVAFVGGVVTLNAQSDAALNERQKRKLMKRIKASQPIQIDSDNSLGSPLYIQEASVKEISGEDFITLAGEAPRHLRQSTFPEVSLWNGSEKTITSFAILIQSATDKPNSWHGLLKSKLSILPNSTYKIISSEWPRAEKVFIEKEGKFVSSLQQPGIDSAKSWIPGAASDLKVVVGMVEFDDGTKWMVPSTSKE
jgi:hypothetical protein